MTDDSKKSEASFDKKKKTKKEKPANDSADKDKTTLWTRVKKGTSNAKDRTVTSSKNAKESIKISQAKSKILARKKDFGVEYLDLMKGGASPTDLEECVKKANSDIAVIEGKIAKWEETIAQNKDSLQKKVQSQKQ